MIPKIWLINLALALLMVFFGIKAADVWFDDDGSVLNRKVSEKPTDRIQEKKINLQPVPPEAAYGLVVEKNIFSPERKEYLPPQETVSETSPEPVELAIPGKKVILYGVVIMDGYKKALVTNLDKTLKKDVVWVEEGQSLGDYRVSRIEKAKVLVQGNNQEYEISLYSGDKPARKTVSLDTGKPSVITATGGSEAAPRTQATPPAPPAAKTEAAPEQKQRRSVTHVKESDGEYEIIDTPFGPFKRKIN